MRSRTAGVLTAGAVGLAIVTGCSSSGGTPSPSSPTGRTSSTSSAAPTSTTPSSGAVVPARSTAVEFTVAGTKTYGTLEVPAHRSGQRLGAALLIPGSGPTDRNGNDVALGDTADTLQIIAGLLAKQGIMTLRYDKYFAGQTGTGAFSSDPGSITMQDFFTQADAAYAFLAGQPEADPAKLLVVGHSEGGMVALAVANSVPTKPAGLALLEPQDERQLDLLRLQVDDNIDGLVQEGKLTESQAATNKQLVATAISRFRAGRTVSTSGMSSLVVPMISSEILEPTNVNFSRSDDRIVPAQLAAKVKSGTRVLVTDGTRDPNVPPSTIGPLVQALKSANVSGPGLQLLQDTDHYMHLPTQPDSRPLLAPQAIQAIDSWAQPFAS